MIELPASSLIICSRNRPKLLADSVDSVLKGDHIPTEIVIVDQSDRPNPILEKTKPECNCEIRYLWSQTIGQSRARNIGMETARFDVLVHTDDDVLVDPGWFAVMVNALCAAGKKSAMSGRVLPFLLGEKGYFVPAIKEQKAAEIYRGRIGKDVLYGNNFSLFRTAVDEIGFFDERLGVGTHFPGADDNDFGYRLLEAGYSIIYEPEAIVYHRAWRSKDDFLPLRWGYGLARGAFYAKYLSLRDRYMLKRMVQDIRRHLLTLPVLFRLDRTKAYGHIMLASGILVGAARWLWTQRVLQKT